jgi:cytochrome c553
MNKFIISEEEKSRILEMHETATNKQYLSEQVAKPLSNVDIETLENFLNKIKTGSMEPTHWVLDPNNKINEVMRLN